MLDPNDPRDISSYEKTRNIVKEIIDYSVSQDEIFNIIKLLSMELENRDVMLGIMNILTCKRQKEDKKENIIF